VTFLEKLNSVKSYFRDLLKVKTPVREMLEFVSDHFKQGCAYDQLQKFVERLCEIHNSCVILYERPPSEKFASMALLSDLNARMTFLNTICPICSQVCGTPQDVARIFPGTPVNLAKSLILTEDRYSPSMYLWITIQALSGVGSAHEFVGDRINPELRLPDFRAQLSPFMLTQTKFTLSKEVDFLGFASERVFGSLLEVNSLFSPSSDVPLAKFILRWLELSVPGQEDEVDRFDALGLLVPVFTLPGSEFYSTEEPQSAGKTLQHYIWRQVSEAWTHWKNESEIKISDGYEKVAAAATVVVNEIIRRAKNDQEPIRRQPPGSH
jgi:hypothetical protein